MKYFGQELSEVHKELSGIIRKPKQLEQAKQLFFTIHSQLHSSQVYGIEPNSIDALLSDLTASEYAIMPTSKDETIAWVIWHIARIEDLTMSVLVAEGPQVFDETWKERLHAPITDTGNALSDDEIMKLSIELNIPALLEYRNQVGIRTRQIVSSLNAEDMKRRPEKELMDRILLEGGVTTQQDSIWLLDFWAKKDVAGLLLMPPTRHVMLHLNDCFHWKEVIRTKKNFYREA